MTLGAAWCLLLLAAPPAHTPARGSVVVATVPTQKGKGPAFEVSVGDCVKPKGAPAGVAPDCGVVVSLKGKGASGRQRLEWTARPGAIVQQDARTVVIGDDVDTAMALTVRAVELKKGVEGVVVTQQTGSDRVKRRHDVLLNLRGKLNHAFTATEPRGPATFSSIGSVDLDNDGFGELVLIQSQAPDEDAPDAWSAATYVWRADLQRVVGFPSWRPTVQGALVGLFNNVKEARELQKNKCLREFLVVDSKSATLLPDGMNALVYLAPTVEEADLALEAAKACDETLVGSVKPMTPGLDVKE